MESTFSSARTTNRPASLSEYRDIGDMERAICGMTGAAFLLHGAKRRGWNGLATALLGGIFVYMSAMGRNALYRNLGIRLVRTTAGGQRCEVVRNIRSIGLLAGCLHILEGLSETAWDHVPS